MSVSFILAYNRKTPNYNSKDNLYPNKFDNKGLGKQETCIYLTNAPPGSLSLKRGINLLKGFSSEPLIICISAIS